MSSNALAHEGKPHTWHDLWRSWSFEPLVVIFAGNHGLAVC